MVDVDYFRRNLGYSSSDIRFMNRLDSRIRRIELGEREPFFLVTIGAYLRDLVLDGLDKITERD